MSTGEGDHLQMFPKVLIWPWVGSGGKQWRRKGLGNPQFNLRSIEFKGPNSHLGEPTVDRLDMGACSFMKNS